MMVYDRITGSLYSNVDEYAKSTKDYDLYRLYEDKILLFDKEQFEFYLRENVLKINFGTLFEFVYK